MISRDQQLEAINKIVASKRLRSLAFGRNLAWRRERVQFLVSHVTGRVNAGIPITPGFKEASKKVFTDKYGSALLTFLLFQLIWYLIQKYLLD